MQTGVSQKRPIEMTDLSDTERDPKVAKEGDDLTCPICCRKDLRFTSVRCKKCSRYIHVSSCSDLTHSDLASKAITDAFNCRLCIASEIEAGNSMSVDEDDDDSSLDSNGLLSKILSELKALRKDSLELKKVVREVEILRSENAELKKMVSKIIDSRPNNSDHVRNSRYSNNIQARSRSNSKQARSSSNSKRTRSHSNSKSTGNGGRQRRLQQPATPNGRSSSRGSRGLAPKSHARVERGKTTANDNNKHIRAEQKTLRVSKQSQAQFILPKSNIRFSTAKAMIVLKDTDIDCKGIAHHLANNNIAVDRITSLKQKFAHYRTFIIEGIDVSINALFDDNIWDDDTFVKSYNGSPHPQRVDSTFQV